YRLAWVARESAIHSSLFRLSASRDFAAPPEQCVALADDGVTLTVDLARADLLLESELTRFAEPAGGTTAGQRSYRLTPASLAAARSSGMTVQGLEAWFMQRVGGPASPAALLLLAGSEEPAPALRQHLILHVATAEPDVTADGRSLKDSSTMVSDLLPEGGVEVNDLRAFLLELASSPARLRQNQTLYQKEHERFAPALDPLSPWAARFLWLSVETR